MANPSCTKLPLDPIVEENIGLKKENTELKSKYVPKGFKPIQAKGTIKAPQNVKPNDMEAAFINTLKEADLKTWKSKKEKDKILFLVAVNESGKEVARLEISDFFYIHKNTTENIIKMMDKLKSVTKWLESMGESKSVKDIVISKTGFFYVNNGPWWTKTKKSEDKK